MPNSLLSVAEMYRFNASMLVEMSRAAGWLTAKVESHSEIRGAALVHNFGPVVATSDDLMTTFSKIYIDCTEMGLAASAATCKRILERLAASQISGDDPKVGDFQGDYSDFQGRLRDELHSSFCFVIEKRSADLFRDAHGFGEAIEGRFPDVAFDIEEAGRCLALDRATAAVFHLMRVLEVGLNSLATKLGIPNFKPDQNWQVTIDQVEKAVRALPFKTLEERQFSGNCSAAALFLKQVKDAWRNGTMHPRDVYTVEQAEEIYRLAKSLMGKLTECV